MPSLNTLGIGADTRTQRDAGDAGVDAADGGRERYGGCCLSVGAARKLEPAVVRAIVEEARAAYEQMASGGALEGSAARGEVCTKSMEVPRTASLEGEAKGIRKV